MLGNTAGSTQPTLVFCVSVSPEEYRRVYSFGGQTAKKVSCSCLYFNCDRAYLITEFRVFLS